MSDAASKPTSRPQSHNQNQKTTISGGGSKTLAVGVVAGTLALAAVSIFACVVSQARHSWPAFRKKGHCYIAVEHGIDGEAIEMEDLLPIEPAELDVMITWTNTDVDGGHGSPRSHGSDFGRPRLDRAWSTT